MPDQRPSPRQVAGKIAARVRARGVGEVLRLARDRIRDVVESEDMLIFFARPASAPPSPRPGPPGLKFRQATAEDRQRYERDIGTDSARSFRARLSASTRCFLVMRDQLIVHSTWVTTGAAWTREVRRYFRPPPGDAYIYESFTRPEVRGQGVYPFALEAILGRLAREAIARAWVGVEADNPASIKSVTKAGFEPGFEMSFRRRFGRLYIGSPKGPLAEACRGCLQD